MNMAAHNVSGSLGPARRLLIMMFCAGIYAMLAQILLLRELLVAFYGNELTIATMLSAWLVVIGAGSLMVRPLLRRAPAFPWQWCLVVLLILLAVVLPAQVFLIRIIRSVLHVPYGEYVSFDAMLAGTTLLLLPTGLSIGIIFPCACHLAGAGGSRAVGRLYAVESLGSMLGGGAFTFAFVLWLTPWATLAVASLVALAGAAVIAPRAAVRYCLLLPILALAVAVACPRCLAGLEWKSIEARWRAFGCLPASSGAVGDQGLPESAGAENVPRLAASVDSRYQNLALIEAQKQMTLYGNGQVMAVFPDPISGEHKINFIMAQNPAASTVLLIGGNPVTDIPELLKYPLKRLVHVELDGEISRLLDRAGGPEYRQAVRDPRCHEAIADGPRFLKTCRETFDIIIVDAPEPTTIALNRFYTLDFYRAAKRCMSPVGFLYTSVVASEQLQNEAAGLSASIRQSLQAVFPLVLVTAGTCNRYFAGMNNSPLTFDRQTLFQRSAGAGLSHRYFRPEYFLNADEISPDKTEYVKKRLQAIAVPANTALRPVSIFYHLMLWSRFSGSRLDRLLNGLRRLPFDWVWGGFLAAGSLLLLVGLGLGFGRRYEGSRGEMIVQQRWARGMLILVVAATGWCTMALELALIFMFQSLLGYIYVRIGLIVAVFMLGLMLGAMTAARLTVSSRWCWMMMIGADLLLLVMALAIPSIMTRFLHSSLPTASGILMESVIDGLILLAGWAGGAQFVAVNHLLRDTGMPTGTAVASAHAADMFGSALGGLTMGVILIPLWGIQTSCLLLVALKGASLLSGISARLATRGRQ